MLSSSRFRPSTPSVRTCAQVGQLSGELNSLHSTVQEGAQNVANLKSQIESEIGRLGQALTDSNAAFQQSQSERAETFTARLTEFASQLREARDAASEAVTETLDSLKEQSEGAWGEISALQERAEAASNYLGINSLAGGYSQTADAEDSRAFWLRTGAVACFLGAIAASVFALIYHVVRPFTIEGFFAKAAVALPFLVLAGYLARESSQHRDRANFSRQRQRQLESLPAYVDGLEPARRAVLYEALAPGFFSPVMSSRSAKEGEPAGGDPAAAAIDLLIEEMKKRVP
jgi:hypothetical protein